MQNRGMSSAPEVKIELPGWELVLGAPRGGRRGRSRSSTALRARVADEARAALHVELLAADPTVATVRRLFRAAGCDPTRYRPSSEALLRRILPGGDLPWISPLVDLNNCLSVALRLPCCVVDAASVVPPVVLRAGRAGEVLDSMRGPIDLEGKPLLADAEGPFGTPISDSHRVKVRPETRRGAAGRLPAGGRGHAARAAETLDALLAAAPAARRTA